MIENNKYLKILIAEIDIYLCICLDTGSHYVTQGDLELWILLASFHRAEVTGLSFHTWFEICIELDILYSILQFH